MKDERWLNRDVNATGTLQSESDKSGNGKRLKRRPGKVIVVQPSPRVLVSEAG
jgi:hypothetical protein